jgi:hypothetical protein
MYKCQNCKCSSEPKETLNKVVVSKREVEYNNKIDDRVKTSRGFETVKEINVCKKCVGKYE